VAEHIFEIIEKKMKAAKKGIVARLTGFGKVF
jgi:hypothetical protein